MGTGRLNPGTGVAVGIEVGITVPMKDRYRFCLDISVKKPDFFKKSSYQDEITPVNLVLWYDYLGYSVA
jgi:hypothetical protein